MFAESRNRLLVVVDGFGFSARRQVRSVRSQSLPLVLLTLTSINELFSAATGAGPSGGYARYSRHPAAVGWVHHSGDCFSAEPTRGPDPVVTYVAPISLP
jgi:hypothetical protein